MRAMYERSYGPKYEALGGYASAAEIAKRMRADIKAEIEAGNLPGSMSNYSVRVDNYSGGRSIDIEAKGFEGMWEKKMISRFGRKQEEEVLTEEGERIRKILQGIHWAYNHDGSDSQVDYFDVNYYGHAEIESPWRAQFRAEERVRREAKAAKKAAAPPPKPYVVPAGRPQVICDKPRCGAPATVMQIGKERYFPTDKPRCNEHKRGAVRPIQYEGVSA
jgi:hypothetical protein